MRVNVILRYARRMRRAREVDVLLALLGTDRTNRLSGEQLIARLHDAGCRTNEGSLLGKLLGLETTGHVAVERRRRTRSA